MKCVSYRDDDVELLVDGVVKALLTAEEKKMQVTIGLSNIIDIESRR